MYRRCPHPTGLIYRIYVLLFMAMVSLPQPAFSSNGLVRLPEGFYEHPDRGAVVEMFRQIVARERLGTDNQNFYRFRAFQIMGFLARVSQDNPGWIEDWLPYFDRLDQNMKLLVVTAITSGQSGERDRALKYFSDNGSQKLIEERTSKDLSNVLKFEVIHPGILNTFSGAYAASGDVYYLVQILKGFAMSLPSSPDGTRHNALMSHLIPATIGSLYWTDSKARRWFDEQIALDAYGIGDLLRDIVKRPPGKMAQ